MAKNIKTSDLIPDDKNFNKGSEFGKELIDKSFRKFGAGRSILLDKNNRIIAGNKSVENAAAIGIEDVQIVESDGKRIIAVKRMDIDLDSPEGREMALADNATAKANIVFDAELIEAEVGEAVCEEWGIETGKQVDAQEDGYEVPDDIKTDIVLGDLFEIGEHRLLCGSSTEANAVAKLLNGKEPYLMVTDPPYGVNYDANWRNEADRADGRPIGARATMKVNNDDQSDWTEAWVLSPAKVAYVWHAGKFSATVQQSLEKSEFQMRSQIIWVKNNIVISRGDYHWKHEPCWYAVKKGNKGNWASDRKQTTVWEIDKPMKSETGHSTQKPVECMAKPIANHDGDVYDPFLGSGTTMVAAHQLNRKCYGMELDPKYCQVIVDRMLKLDPAIEVKLNGKPYKSNG